MKKCEMATTSPSFSEVTAFKEISKGKLKKKEAKKELKTLTITKKLKTLPKESKSSELSSSKSFVISVSENSVPEAVWEIEYSEPVPDLYPELSDSLKMEESDAEHDERAKVCESQCDSEENVQCVPTSFNDDHLSQDSPNNPVCQQSHDDSQRSSSNSQTTVNNSKRKRKLAKPKKARKQNYADSVQDTSRENFKQLDQAQGTEKQGTWAQCSIPSCGKWRFLQNDVDPQDLPERWICSMNENDDYNTCSVSQETFDSQEGNLDVMYTPYPSGAVVWAKMVGYPWWPAMMENDPDYGYYCETGEDNVTPISYHVVFFDKQVSRAWVNAACIRNFSCDDDPEDMGKISFKGKNYRRQLTTATLAARSAAQMPLQTRLLEYGFAARYQGTIGDKAQKKERAANLELEELIDSVTDSSSQEICSSGNSYSSAEDVKHVEPKSPTKPKTSKKKPTNKPAKNVAKTKESCSSSLKKETGKNEDKAKAEVFTLKASVTTSSNNNERLPENNDGGISTETSGTIHETERIQKQHDENLVVTKEHESLVLCVSRVETNSAEAIPTEEKSSCKVTSTKPRKTSVEKSSSTQAKVVKKKQCTNEVQGGKKRKMSNDVPNNLENSLSEDCKQKEAQSGKKRKMSKSVQNNLENNFSDHSKQKEQDKVNNSAVNTTESWSSKAKQKEQDVIENSKQPVENVEEIQTNAEGNKDSGNSSKLSTSSECLLGVPEQKQQRKKSGKSKSISQDKPVEQLSTMKKAAVQVVKSSEGGTSSSDVLAQNGECEQQQVPGFAPRRSAASTDVRVALDEDSLARKKPLPKLVKAAFKPPVATKGNNNRAKMPKLLKPNFVSPTLAKRDNSHDIGQEVREEKIPKSVAFSDAFQQNAVAKKKLTLKREAQCKDQCPAGGASSKKAKETTSCQAKEDLQAEIDVIDDDIASIRKELGVSDTSDTSLPEEMITSSVAQQQISLLDSPEF